MPSEKILIYLSDQAVRDKLENGTLRTAGYQVLSAEVRGAFESMLSSSQPDVVILEDVLPDGIGLELAGKLIESHPQLAIILYAKQHSDVLAVNALRTGIVDYLYSPLKSKDLLAAVRRACEHNTRLERWLRLETRRDTKTLRRRINQLEALNQVGRKVTAVLDLDEVLSAVVDAAVELTNAEEGSLLLLDQNSGELYMRAARNFQEEFVRTFRLPVQDTLPGQVLQTGKPLLLHETTPKKIKTAYLVHSLIYVPLQIQDKAIGVLGVDNRHGRHKFTEDHLTLVSSLADYAAIAIENARLYATSEIERSKLETILTKIKDGVIVIDHDHRLILANQTSREVFDIVTGNKFAQPINEIIHNDDFINLIQKETTSQPYRGEITVQDGRVFHAQVTPIPEVGLVITMQDITHLKELDSIKNDFVSIVSHDLRSPLTAILGYVELISRVGEINSQQEEFINRVQLSVQNITDLINDLLDLGRIEAGFDSQKEIVAPVAILELVIEGYMARAFDHQQSLEIEVAGHVPTILCNPIRLRQMVENMVDNALKYTPQGGKIILRSWAEDQQVFIQVQDNGPGIPAADQPYIFDKFYRARNVAGNNLGTGLGLAIVKSIVENHNGRIWVDSIPGQGSSFTVVLPIADQEL